MKGGILRAAFGSSQSVSNLDHWIIRAIAGGKTKAGVNVSHYNAVTMPAVWACITLLADTLHQLPIDVMQRVGERKEDRPDHPVARLLSAEGNTDMGPRVLINTAQAHAAGWGNGYLEIERDGRDTPRQLWPLLPDRTEPDIRVSSEGERTLRYKTNVDGTPVPVASRNVIHIRGWTFDGIRGMSPIEYARHAIGLGLATEEFGSKFFANDARSGGFLQHPDQLGPEAKKNIQDSLSEEGEGLDQAHRVKILEEGMKYVATTISPEDSQFLLTREFQVAEIARMWRVPLVLINSHQKDTAWGTGIEQLMIGFVKWTIAPWLTRWEEELSRKLLTEEERKAGYYIKFNLNSLLRGDMKTRADYYAKGFGKWLTVDDVRDLEDMNPTLDLPYEQQAATTTETDDDEQVDDE